MLQSQSLSSWLLSRSFRVVGFGTVKESLFEMWLSDQLGSCAFGALPLAQVISGGVGGLELDQGEVLRLLALLLYKTEYPMAVELMPVVFCASAR